MADIKPIGASANKYQKNAAAASGDYKSGIETTPKDWAGRTAAAEGAYTTGVQDAISRGAFAKGVTKAGTQNWKNKALKFGPNRYAEGVRTAGPDWQRGFAPFQDVISAIALPPKGAKNSPENYARVPAVGNALHAKKIELQG